ncbi:MAG: hypothetical protein KGJ78_12760 [Alphaproteobacteria bacterium]|nr:hypothetical protein [Alphaproteobacteria bacterium]
MNWFRKVGPVYLPCSMAGWSLTAVVVVMAARTFLMVDRFSHSASDTLLGAGPIIALLFLLLWLVAAKASRQGR